MKLNIGEIKGIKFYYRGGMSDKKTFDEVLGNEVYLKNQFMSGVLILTEV